MPDRDLKEVSARISADIDKYVVDKYSDGHRNHLGASVIGHACNAHIWGVFRWLEKDQHSGRMLRLFQRGHREEAWLIELLRGIGCTVWTHDENGKQFKISAVYGHFGGSMDAALKLPERYGIDEILLCEFKTMRTGSAFNNLVKNGVEKENKRHLDQFSLYASAFGLKHTLYITVNKNDDNLHIEIVPTDTTGAAASVHKAERIILSDMMPDKVALQRSYFLCKMCQFAEICHDGALPDKNCRSCTHARPIDGGAWHCGHYEQDLDKETIATGCDVWSPIVNGDK